MDFPRRDLAGHIVEPMITSTEPAQPLDGVSLKVYPPGSCPPLGKHVFATHNTTSLSLILAHGIHPPRVSPSFHVPPGGCSLGRVSAGQRLRG